MVFEGGADVLDALLEIVLVAVPVTEMDVGADELKVDEVDDATVVDLVAVAVPVDRAVELSEELVERPEEVVAVAVAFDETLDPLAVVVAVAVADVEPALVEVPLPAVDVWIGELLELLELAGSVFTVHFETFSNTSLPTASFFGVKVISQVSVLRPVGVSVVLVVTTTVDPSGLVVVWRDSRAKALAWAEKKRSRDRKTKKVDWN